MMMLFKSYEHVAIALFGKGDITQINLNLIL